MPLQVTLAVETKYMPYPNEHAARLKEPDQYEDWARQNDRFGKGVDAIWGIKRGKPQLQALRFDKETFTAAEAKKWLKSHNYDPILFEAAEGEEKSKKKKKTKKKKSAGALYPSLVAPEDFRPGDVVRKIFGDFRVTEYTGIILAVHPTTQTVDVRWPYGIGFENPQDLVRVNPFFEPPTVVIDGEGYYTTWDAERWNSKTDVPSKGVSGRSPLYHDTRDIIDDIIKNAATTTNALPSYTFTSNVDNNTIYVNSAGSVTLTEGSYTSADNAIEVTLDNEIPDELKAARIADRYVRRAFNVLLRAASHPYNAGLNDLQTYSLLYRKFGQYYSEPSIRKVVSYLYGEPHTYAVEDFDRVIQAAVVAAQEKDKKLLKEMFLAVVGATQGDTGKSLNDLLDFSIETPHAKEIYNNFRHAVRRGGGRLDLLPTPSARFASQEKQSDEVTNLDNMQWTVITLPALSEQAFQQLFDVEEDLVNIAEMSETPFTEAAQKLSPEIAKLWADLTYLEDKTAVEFNQPLKDLAGSGKIREAFNQLKALKS